MLDLKIIWHKCSLCDILPRLLRIYSCKSVVKHGHEGSGLVFLIMNIYLVNTFKIFLYKRPGQIWKWFGTKFNVPYVILYLYCWIYSDSLKNMAFMGRTLFTVYIYMKELKSSCPTVKAWFENNLIHMHLGWPSTKIVEI